MKVSRLLGIISSSIILTTGCATTKWTPVPSPEVVVEKEKENYNSLLEERQEKQGYFIFTGLLGCGIPIPYD